MSFLVVLAVFGVMALWFVAYMLYRVVDELIGVRYHLWELRDAALMIADDIKVEPVPERFKRL